MNIQHIGDDNLPPELKHRIEAALSEAFGNINIGEATPSKDCQCPRCRLAALKDDYAKSENATIAEAKAIGKEVHAMGQFLDMALLLREFTESQELPKLISGFTRLKSDVGVKCVTELQTAYREFIKNMDAVMTEVEQMDEAKKIVQTGAKSSN